jgi:hypothetical protein
MEVTEEFKALKNELKLYKEHIEGLNAEKVALDQMLVENLKNSLQSKKELVLKEEQLKKLNVEVEAFKKEREGLLKQIADLKAKNVEDEIDMCLNENTSS